MVRGFDVQTSLPAASMRPQDHWLTLFATGASAAVRTLRPSTYLLTDNNSSRRKDMLP